MFSFKFLKQTALALNPPKVNPSKNSRNVCNGRRWNLVTGEGTERVKAQGCCLLPGAAACSLLTRGFSRFGDWGPLSHACTAYSPLSLAAVLRTFWWIEL